MQAEVLAVTVKHLTNMEEMVQHLGKGLQYHFYSTVLKFTLGVNKLLHSQQQIKVLRFQ